MAITVSSSPRYYFAAQWFVLFLVVDIHWNCQCFCFYNTELKLVIIETFLGLRAASEWTTVHLLAACLLAAATIAMHGARLCSEYSNSVFFTLTL